jgi:signal transduction histidine kinase
MTGESSGRLAQLSRAYAVVSAVRRVIVRAAGEKELFERACRIAVQEGRFRFAWIGAVDRAASRIVPVVSAGHDDGYLDHIRIDLGDTPNGRGPSGTAVRDGKPCVANDLGRDVHVSPWREAALARGYRSSAGFPVRRAGEVVAVLSLYSGEPNSFDPAEVALFSDMVEDIGFALDTMDAAERRRAAEQERKRLQTQLLLADRMASMGRLAAGTAHEINNPLAYVSLNLELVAGRLSKGAPLDDPSLEVLREAVERAREGAERVRQIVRALSSFSRGEEAPVGAVDVDRALDAAIDVTAPQVRHRATVVRDYHSSRCARANEFRLGQVLVNLLINAADAMSGNVPDRNTITVRTRSEGERVFVEIADTGVGIPVEARAKIFDPFFTTKPVGMGTGLGLAVCHGIVTAYGGEISVESEVGRGTRMCFWLPAAAEPGSEQEPAVLRHTSDFAGARVLVVDDEPAIGMTIREALAEHHVTVTQSAREALELCATTEFDCILSDVSMPEMSGLDLYDAIARRWKGLERRLVFITGGAIGEQQRAALAALGAPCLEKPFNLASLADVVRRAAQG